MGDQIYASHHRTAGQMIHLNAVDAVNAQQVLNISRIFWILSNGRNANP